MSEFTEQLKAEQSAYKLLCKYIEPKPGTQARVHKGVRPYGGKIFTVQRTVIEADGRRHIDLCVNAAGDWSSDIREYDPKDIDILEPKQGK